MSNFVCPVCGQGFDSLQEDNFASWSDGETLHCFYGSRFDTDVFEWADSFTPYEGAICDDCIAHLLDMGFIRRIRQRKLISL